MSPRRTKLHHNKTHRRDFYMNESAACTAGPKSPNPRDEKLPWPVEMLSPTTLLPSPRNVRTHSKKQIAQVATSIKAFGFINPIIVDKNGTIICGHARVEAARLLGIRSVPTIRVSHLNEAELRAYMLADNKLAENAGWDRQALATELIELQIALPEFELDLSVTGFETAEIDSVFGDFGDDRPDPLDDVPSLEKIVVSRGGELFTLGNHRLIVGDARDRRNSLAANGHRNGYDGLSGSTVQRQGRWPCGGPWPYQAPRIQVRLGGNDAEAVRRISSERFGAMCAIHN